MPFQKGNKWGKVSKRKTTAKKEEPTEEKNVETNSTSPIRKAMTLYRDPTGWVVDLIDIQDGKVVNTQTLCPSTLKFDAVETFKVQFAHIFINES